MPSQHTFRLAIFQATLMCMRGKEALFRDIFARHQAVVAQSATEILPDVERGAAIILKALKAGKKVLICGNGGSAADSQHLATELVGRYAKNRKALPAIALTTDASALTAIGNDWDFSYVFARQIEALGHSGDVLIAITTSGTSKNVLAAIKAARAKKMRIIVLTGTRGAKLKANVDVCIAVPSIETARTQEVHELIYHAWCEYIDENVR